MSTKVAIIGKGKMGQMLAALAPEQGCEVVAHLGRVDTAQGVRLDQVASAEVVIEFTVPHEAARLVRAVTALGLPIVSGTTGWDAERSVVEADVRASNGALLWAANFSVGVYHFLHVVAEAAKRYRASLGYDAQIIETHHVQKLDAPSGTAKVISQTVERQRGAPVKISSIRTGEVPGTHEVIFDAPFEQIRLVHEARDRRIFAAGALTAAKWLVGKRGVFSLGDFLEEGQ